MKRSTKRSQSFLLFALIFLILSRVIHYFLGHGSANLRTKALNWFKLRHYGSSKKESKVLDTNVMLTESEQSSYEGMSHSLPEWQKMFEGAYPIVSMFSATLQDDEQAVILHPYLFALFPSLSLVADHRQLLSINRSVVAMATSAVITTFLSLRLIKSIVKDEQKASLLVSLVLLLFFAYGHVYDFLTINLNKLNVRHRHLLLAWSLLAIGAISFSLRDKGNKTRYSTFLNIVSGCLVVISSVQIVRDKLAAKGKWHSSKFVNIRLGDAISLPDIYYIILDAHASSSTLKEFYNHDIGALIERLKAKGFFIVDKSYSNYAMTVLSLASSLNMEYLDSLGNQIGSEKQDLYLLKQMIEDNIVMRILRSIGYKTIFLGSGFGITQRNQYADVEIACGYVDETLGQFIQSTLFRVLADRLRLIARDKYNRVIRMFSELGRIHNFNGPKFTFAHIPSPQWPFLFDANGKLINGSNLDSAQQKEAYLNQLIFIDKKVEELIEKILTGSSTAPIIILQSDHGPNFAFPGKYYLQNPPPEVLQEKMRIFNAFYLPGCENDFLYDFISPVNTFRLIFNRYFGSNFLLLNDESYFSTLQFPYRLTNVTNLVVND
jgi:hypothetical protein